MWKQTLNLPKSLLGKRSNAARNAELFPKVTSQLYKKQLELNNRPIKTLHDGPPYANGELHMGHALNKILKDFVNRTRVLMGDTVKYTPGWDCHGLPIELKALAGVKTELTSIEKRQRARELARKMVAVQSEQFQSYCLMADFSDVYLTMNPEYVYNELQLFRKLVAENLVSRQEKPVFWSPESKTALAESELVYAVKESTACYVGYIVTNPSLVNLGTEKGPVQLVIWTTTPWTLVANQAIAVNERVDYIFLRSSNNTVYIVSEPARATLADINPNQTLTEVGRCKGSDLIGLQYTCPLRGSVHNVVHGDHVTADGTGLVHTAPAHGKEDYLVGLRNKLPVKSVVDAHGKYVDDFGLGLKGLDARKNGTQIILQVLADAPQLHLLNVHKVSHSVPLDWRSNKPVLIRSTKQFFINLQSLRERASAALKSVTFIPKTGIDRLEAFINTRSEWCISRQRCWGVPIPVFVDKVSGEPVLDDEIIDFVISQMKAKGVDAWFVPDSEFHISEWLPADRQSLSSRVNRCQDTLDVWLDSGSSFLNGYKNPATTYLEGSDQHRGWFQSSLLLNAVLHQQAPFEQLVTHGFVLDQHKQKMSKSVGNVISPKTLIKQIGVDGLRLFIAQSNYTSDISMNGQSIESAAALVKKLRLTFNFLLGNTVDYTPSKTHELNLLDKYMLCSLQDLKTTVLMNFEQLNFQNAVRHIQVHLNSLMSAVYFDSVKDTLYTDQAASSRRRAVQFVLLHALATYVRILSPLIPLLTQEVWEACPALITNNSETPLLAAHHDLPRINPEEVAQFPKLIELRDLVNECVELAKQDKVVTSALTCDIYIQMDVPFAKELIETVCVASNVKFGTSSSKYTLTKNGVTVSVTEPSMNKCERCWKHNAVDSLCHRCHSVVHS